MDGGGGYRGGGGGRRSGGAYGGGGPPPPQHQQQQGGYYDGPPPRGGGHWRGGGRTGGGGGNYQQQGGGGWQDGGGGWYPQGGGGSRPPSGARGGGPGGGGGGNFYPPQHQQQQQPYYDDGSGYRPGGGQGRGRGRGGRYSWGRGGTRSGGGRSGGGGGGRGGGGGGRGGGAHTSQQEALPEDLAVLTALRKHTKPVSCLAYDPSTQQLYSGARDGQLCAWSCATGALASCADVGGEVDSLLVEAGFLFAGVSLPRTAGGPGAAPVGIQARLGSGGGRGGGGGGGGGAGGGAGGAANALAELPEGVIKVWNLSTGATHTLTGHRGQVLALAAANGALFSGGQDASLRVWAFSAAAGLFTSQAVLTAESAQGHRTSVQALAGAGGLLFSGDRAGVVKVWDCARGQCVQTIERAHSHAVMALLVWGDNYLLSAGLDGLVHCWSPGAGGAGGGGVLSAEPEFTFNGQPPEDEAAAAVGGRRPPPAAPPSGVLAMSGAADGAGRPVLMLSRVGDRGVRLYDLPSFEARGGVPAAPECRALASLPGGVMVAGDRNGTVHVLSWAPQVAAAAPAGAVAGGALPPGAVAVA